MTKLGCLVPGLTGPWGGVSRLTRTDGGRKDGEFSGVLATNPTVVQARLEARKVSVDVWKEQMRIPEPSSYRPLGGGGPQLGSGARWRCSPRVPVERAAQERNDLAWSDSRDPCPHPLSQVLGAGSKFHAFCKMSTGCALPPGGCSPPPPSSLQTRCKVWWQRRSHLGRRGP